MRGYSEYRGQVSKLDFDAETKHFVMEPIENVLQLEPSHFSLLEKLLKWRKLNSRKAAHRQTMQQLAKFTDEQRNDVGISDVYTGQKS